MSTIVGQPVNMVLRSVFSNGSMPSIMAAFMVLLPLFQFLGLLQYLSVVFYLSVQSLQSSSRCLVSFTDGISVRACCTGGLKGSHAITASLRRRLGGTFPQHESVPSLNLPGLII